MRKHVGLIRTLDRYTIIYPRNLSVDFWGSLADSEGSELFRKVGEDAGSNFHLLSSKSGHGRPSYDRKIKRVGSREEIPS